MDQPDQIATLEQWAEWGRACVHPRFSRPDWSAVDVLIEAAQPRLLEDSKALREILERSRNQLKFTDPLLCDLGVHWWLERENSYSDWLAWVLRSLHDTKAVLRVLGIPDGEFERLCYGDYVVERECAVAKGNENSTGRIDLLIRFEAALIGVEVKTEDEDYDKQSGYKDSLEKLGGISGQRVQCVLVANCDVPDDRRCGFSLRKWEDLSIALRGAICAYINAGKDGVVAAMMVGFVAAVEHRLLGFGIAGPARAQKGRPTLMPTKLLEYLSKLGVIDGNQNTAANQFSSEGS